MTPQGPPQTPKVSPIIWVLAILGAVIVLALLAVVVGGLFLAHKAKEAGVDAELFRKHPGVAITKMVAAMNPNAEIVSVDEGRGVLTIRDKRTGKEVTLKFDDVRAGKVIIEGDGKREVIVSGEAAGANLPRWVPRYPGASAKANVSVVQNEEQDTGNITMTTPDEPAKVLEYYQHEFRKQGPAWKTSVTTTDEGGVIHAADENTERIITLAVARSGGDTTINLTFTRK